MPTTAPHENKGISIIDLLVGMVIGAFFVYISMKNKSQSLSQSIRATQQTQSISPIPTPQSTEYIPTTQELMERIRKMDTQYQQIPQPITPMPQPITPVSFQQR